MHLALQVPAQGPRAPATTPLQHRRVCPARVPRAVLNPEPVDPVRVLPVPPVPLVLVDPGRVLLVRQALLAPVAPVPAHRVPVVPVPLPA